MKRMYGRGIHTPSPRTLITPSQLYVRRPSTSHRVQLAEEMHELGTVERDHFPVYFWKFEFRTAEHDLHPMGGDDFVQIIKYYMFYAAEGVNMVLNFVMFRFIVMESRCGNWFMAAQRRNSFMGSFGGNIRCENVYNSPSWPITLNNTQITYQTETRSKCNTVYCFNLS